ncbi:MAG: ribonuclease Z, partial [Ktedonobacterales bacterium]
STFVRAQEVAARASKHMTAFEAGEQAAVCGVEELALVHIGGGWPTEQGIAEAAQAFAGAITIPDDGDEITV